MKVDTSAVSTGFQAIQSTQTHIKPVQAKTMKSGMESDDAEQVKQNSVADNIKIANENQVASNVETTAEEQKDQNERQVIDAIEKANKHIRTYDRKLEFSIHDETKQIMVKVINTEDESVIREIPSEKVLDMVAHMWEVAGILVDEKR